MNEKQETQLLRWFDEVETEDDRSESDAKSTHDAYSTDDSIDDPEYTQSNSSYSSGDSRDERTGSESSVDSDDPSEQKNNVWEDFHVHPCFFGLTQNIESKTPRKFLN
ncbi:hypothetical protein JTB14_011848 [Gonioctena quinquepunctata]|nr:hypothetical protein JTB14_011848 [Gonioctena quinquepunctata]